MMLRFLNAKALSRFDGLAIGIVVAAWPSLDWMSLLMLVFGLALCSLAVEVMDHD